MRTLALAVSAAVAAAPALAENAAPVPSGAYKLDDKHTSLIFLVQHMGLAPYMARFGDFDVTITLDTADPSASSVTATVRPGSIDTGYPYPETEDFDAKLSGPGWLDAGAHPEARFVSTSVEVTGENTARVTGDFTLNGVTAPATFDVVLTGATESHPGERVPALGIEARATISRSAFGVASLPQFVADDVEIVFRGDFIWSPEES